MSTSSRGSARERQYKALREEEGWTVARLAGSKGAADLICMRRNRGDLELSEIVLSQVKANKGSPWMNFRKAERDSLRAEATKIGASAEMAHWPPNGDLRVYDASEWPT